MKYPVFRGPFVPGLLLVALVAAMGCDRRGGGRSNPPALGPGETAYEVKGVVREFPTDGRSVVIRHEEIPGYMPKMTMTFTVRQTNELRGLSEGDSVSFRLVATETDHWIDSLRRMGSGPPALPYSPLPPMAGVSRVAGVSDAAAAQLQTGDLLPAFAFTGDDGHAGNVVDYRGRAVAFTFVFTRCPLPDFCPRMSKHFSRARELLLARPEAPTNWQLLSISFDPDFDRPEVLARYATQYRGANPDRWRFAVVSREVLDALAPAVDLRVVPEEGSFLHNLRTVVIDSQGRVFRQFDRNDWTPEDLADALVQAARVPMP